MVSEKGKKVGRGKVIIVYLPVMKLLQSKPSEDPSGREKRGHWKSLKKLAIL